MSLPFQGTALPIDQNGMSEVTDRMGIHAPELWAVLGVETRGCGFLPDRRPAILFERHIFSRETAGRFDASNPDISNPQAGGYGAGGAAQYDRLQRALQLDRKAALRSASWGIGQIMGFNAELAGYPDVETMVSAMSASEDDQLRAMAALIMKNGLHLYLRSHDWTSFARAYNGPDYAKNKYDTRLAAAYQTYAMGALPDLSVRAAQVFLTYLGFHPGTIDGIAGRLTYSALNDFQQQNNLPVTSEINDDVLAKLRERVLAGVNA
jgi:hypothetical protein